MKFSCGRCGKRYATAETPAPGRVYKIKCKACGDFIVVRSGGGPHAGAEELGPAAMMDLASEQSAPDPEHGSVTFELGMPEQHLETPHPVRSESPPPLPLPEPVLEDLPAAARTDGAAAAISAVGLHASLAEDPAELPEAASPGYVDLFSEAARSDGEEQASARGQTSTDPFLAAARASLPDDHGAARRSAPQEVFAAPERQQVAVLASAARLPVIARPPQQKRTGPLMLMGLGALVVVGILAFVLLGGQPPPAPPPPQAAVAPPLRAAPPPQAAVAPSPPPAPSAPVVAALAVAAPGPEARAPEIPPSVMRPELAEPPRPEKRAAATAGAREDRRARDRAAAAAQESSDRAAAEREAAAAREARARDDREAQERERIAREARAREERDAQERERAEQARQEQQQVAAAGLGEPAEALTQDQVQKVLSSTRKVFDACIASAGKSSAVALDGRRVMLRLNIQPTGSVTYPTLDDVTLSGTDLGSCLKSAARVMVFPKFKGDPMHVELPLVLAPAR